MCFIPARAADGPVDVLQMRDFLMHCLAVDKNVGSVQQREPTTEADTENPTETTESSQWETCVKSEHVLMQRLWANKHSRHRRLSF